MVAPVPTQISKLPRRKLSCPSRRPGPNSRPVNLLQPLRSLFAVPALYFQQLAASFHKTPGWGVPKHVSLPTHQLAPSSLRQLSALCASALSFVFAAVHSSWRFLCPPPTTFRMNTCKSVSKQSTLTTFRMNTYEKRGEGGYRDSGFDYPPLAIPDSTFCRPSHAPPCASISRAPQSMAQANPDSPQNSRGGHLPRCAPSDL